MAELKAPYLDDPLSPQQLRSISDFLNIIRKNGGYGCIKLEVLKDSIKFVKLGEISQKFDEGGVQIK